MDFMEYIVYCHASIQITEKIANNIVQIAVSNNAAPRLVVFIQVGITEQLLIKSIHLLHFKKKHFMVNFPCDSSMQLYFYLQSFRRMNDFILLIYIQYM